VPFEDFATSIGSVPELRQLTLNSAFQMILAHRTEVLGKPAQSVFFYVDEFRCLADHCRRVARRLGQDVATFVQDHEFAALTACGTVLRGNPLHTALISTLDHRPLQLLCTRKHYSVDFIILHLCSLFCVLMFSLQLESADPVSEAEPT
jgi:hypothetical protein